MASRCRQPFNQLKVQMDGKVYACSQGQYIGNINNTPIEQLWNSPRILELRKSLTEEDYDQQCMACPLFHNKAKKIKKGNFDWIKAIYEKNNNFFIGNEKIKSSNKVSFFIDHKEKSKDNTILKGWVYSGKFIPKQIAVVMLVNNKYFDHEINSISRPDVKKAFNLFYDKCGFEISTDFVSIEKKIKLLFIYRKKIIGKAYIN
jgi:radical SAM protein with 4Fe4S-binding SPASM domain